MRQWVKQAFSETKWLENFPPHSCRSASTTKELPMNLDISDILKKGCWSDAKTLYEQYKKEIIIYKEVAFNGIIKE